MSAIPAYPGKYVHRLRKEEEDKGMTLDSTKDG
jgi:hypothetical protein